MESFQICCVCYLSCVEISLNMKNKLFLKVSKFKIKNDRYYCFHIGDTQDNFFL